MLAQLCCTAAVKPGKPAECGARPPLELGLSVAHVAGKYPQTLTQLATGLEAIERLGAQSVKLYMTPTYAEKYRDQWPERVRSLVELAGSAPFRQALARPFRTFILTTYSFANGVDGAFLDGLDDLEAEAEYAEVRAFAEYLLRTYAKSGKRFVLQNWEGDWAARGAFESSRAPSPIALGGMRRYVAKRQAAIEDARRAVGEDGVWVDHAFEVNALLGNDGQVLDQLDTCVDALSYSSWEALAPLYAKEEEGAIAKSVANLKRALDRLRASGRGKSNVYLGEIGIAENELPEPLRAHMRNIVDALTSAADPVGVIWWQIYDNECTREGALHCRGYGLYRSDGSKSLLLEALGK